LTTAIFHKAVFDRDVLTLDIAGPRRNAAAMKADRSVLSLRRFIRSPRRWAERPSARP